MDASDYVDDALAVLGGEDTEFYVTATQEEDSHRPKISVNCCYSDCEWAYTIGQMPVWEIAADCREHWEKTHAAKS